MEIKVEVGQTIKIIFDKCPRCHSNWNSKKNKKTMNHTIPSFMNPLTDVLVTTCEACHAELNTHYTDITTKPLKTYKSKDFGIFMKTYNNLRIKFHAKKIERGEFGEGLWKNLTDYLAKIQKED